MVKDRSLYTRFFLVISSSAEYMREFAWDFRKIKQRSTSLTDTDRDRLIRIADFVEGELAEWPGFVELDQTTYERESAKRRNVERWVENIVNASIDLAKILLASEKNRIPQTYREILQELSLIQGFSPELAQELSRFAKLRNVLAHDYLDIRFRHIKNFIRHSEHCYQGLVAFVNQWVEK